MKISLLTPTRGRPDNIVRLIASARETADKPELLEFVFYIDSDDHESYQTLFHFTLSDTVKMIVGARIVLSEMWNECYKRATGEIFMHCGDDIVFKTKGWDSMVRSAFEAVPDKILFVHGNDCAQGESFGTHGFIHKNWTETVGYFVPPYFSSDYNDTWLNEVSNGLQRRRYLPFITEHMHFLFGKGPKDQTHLDRLDRHKQDNVMALYEAKKPERDRDVAKLSEFIRTYRHV